MGTSNSYSGSNSKAGKDLRQRLREWLDSQEGGEDSSDAAAKPRAIPAEALLPAISLLRPHFSSRGHGAGGGGGAPSGSGKDGSGKTGRKGGGAQRTARAAASTAGRAAAAAYAYRTGDRETLEKMGLSYEELQQITDPLELTRKIVDAACTTQESTIEEEEQREVAAEVAEWVLEQSDKGGLPTPEEIVRKSIAAVINDVIASETGEMIRSGKWSQTLRKKVEHEVREASEVLAEKAKLSAGGVTDQDFTQAIEGGIETLRSIIKGSDNG